MKKILLLLLCFASLAAADMLFLKNQDKGLEVTIAKDTWKEVIYEAMGAQITANWDQIDRLEYSSMKRSSYERGESLMKVGNFSGAAEAYVSAIRTMRDPWVRPYCGYRGGMALFYMGSYEKAIKLFNIGTSEPDSHYEPDCYTMIGQCHLKLKNFDEAKEYLNKVGTKYGDSKYSRAQALIIDLKLESGDYANAKIDYDNLRREIGNKEDINGYQIDTKIALCQIKLGQLEPGREKLAGAIATVSSLKNRRRVDALDADAVLAEAYMLRGNSFFDSETKDFEKALRAYLHSAVLYKHVRSAAVAEASYKAGACMIELLKNETDTKVREQMIGKGRELLLQARGLYSGRAGMLRKINALVQEVPPK